jgi:hypothetical protein
MQTVVVIIFRGHICARVRSKVGQNCPRLIVVCKYLLQITAKVSTLKAAKVCKSLAAISAVGSAERPGKGGSEGL